MHRLPGDLDLRSARCRHPLCNKTASFGPATAIQNATVGTPGVGASTKIARKRLYCRCALPVTWSHLRLMGRASRSAAQMRNLREVGQGRRARERMRLGHRVPMTDDDRESYLCLSGDQSCLIWADYTLGTHASQGAQR